MTIATRATISTAVTAGIAIGFSALALRFALHGDLDVYSSHFAMMRSMMGFGPDLTQLFVLVDRTFAMAMLLAVALALAGGVALGASLSRPVGALDRGLARFAAGRLDEPIQEQGPTEIERLARSANVMAASLAAARTAERDPDGTWLRSDDGQLTFAGAVAAVGRTAEVLAEDGIGARVVDLCSVTPIDTSPCSRSRPRPGTGSWSQRTITRRPASAPR